MIGCWQVCRAAGSAWNFTERGFVAGGDFIGRHHVDVLFGAGAAACVAFTAGTCTVLVVGALGTTAWRATVEHGIVGDRPRCVGKFALDLGLSGASFGAGSLAKRAITPHYMRSPGDRRVAKWALDPLLFGFEEGSRWWFGEFAEATKQWPTFKALSGCW
jgi:hypothetical protein